MSHAIFNCPECSSPLGLPEGMAKPGEFIVCPCCDKRIQAPQIFKNYEAQLPTVVRPKRKQQPATDVVTKRHQGKSERTETPPPSGVPEITAKRAKMILLTVASLLAILIGTALFIRIRIVKTCTGRIEQLVRCFESYGEITYGAVCVSPFGRGAEIKDICVTPTNAKKRPVSVDCLILKRLAFHKGVPTGLDIEAYGVHIPIYPETFGKAAPVLRGIDYNCLSSHITCGYRYDPDEDEIRISDLTIRSPTLGECSLSFLISGAELVSDDLTLKRIVRDSRIWGIREARFEYHDDSFIPRFIAYQAEYIGETVEELYRGMLTDLDKTIGKETDPVTREFLTQFRPFVKNPQGVLISTELDGPTSLGHVLSVYDQHGLISLVPTLKLKLTAQ